jgi:cell division protein ZapD
VLLRSRRVLLTVSLYEFPFNEGTRTMLRLEQLFERLGTLVARESAIDHHFALQTLFEIVDVAARADLKSDLLKELERHRTRLEGFRDNPHIDMEPLLDALTRIERAYAPLQASPGKAGHGLTASEWLMAVRSRIAIPGGTCAFDLPAYYAWQQGPADVRRADLERWASTLAPMGRALWVLLSLLRDGARAQRVAAPGGVFQQRLPEGRQYQLLRLNLPDGDARVPEISGHRLMVSVRLMRSDAEGRLKPDTEDASFDLALCA